MTAGRRGGAPPFKVQRKEYTLRFKDYPGMVVVTRAPSTGAFLEISELSARRGNEAEELADAKVMLQRFADHLLYWNLTEEDDSEIPSNYDGLVSLDFDFAQEIIGAWMDASAGVSEKVKPTSSGGSPLMVDSIPMEPLPTSQAS